MKSVIEFSESFQANGTFDEVVTQVEGRVADLKSKGFVGAESTIEPVNVHELTSGEIEAYGYECTIRAWKAAASE